MSFLLAAVAGQGAAPELEYSTTGSPSLRTYDGYQSLHWTSSGTFTITANAAAFAFDVWVVSGGGGAAGGASGGGGGAGGAEAFTSQTLGDAEHTITIGAGGTLGTTPVEWNGTNGVVSSFAINGGSTLATTAGGHGSGRCEEGGNGGSGGGSSGVF